MPKEIATESRVLNECRKLFQKNDEWGAFVQKDGNSLEITIREKYLFASWVSGGSLPYACYNLLTELGWSSGGYGEYAGGLFKIKIYPGGVK
jgi:hypothetical protein